MEVYERRRENILSCPEFRPFPVIYGNITFQRTQKMCTSLRNFQSLTPVHFIFIWIHAQLFANHSMVPNMTYSQINRWILGEVFPVPHILTNRKFDGNAKWATIDSYWFLTHMTFSCRFYSRASQFTPANIFRQLSPRNRGTQLMKKSIRYWRE